MSFWTYFFSLKDEKGERVLKMSHNRKAVLDALSKKILAAKEYDKALNYLNDLDSMLEPMTTVSFCDNRIVNELFNNAVKYSHGTKMILILETENNYTRLKYIDNGIGFESEDIMHQIHDKKVSGLKNIESRVANFNGTLDIKTSVGNGLEINIVVLN